MFGLNTRLDYLPFQFVSYNAVDHIESVRDTHTQLVYSPVRLQKVEILAVHRSFTQLGSTSDGVTTDALCRHVVVIASKAI